MSNYHEKVLRAIYIKPRFRMELLFWPVLYFFRADLVRVEISLDCGTSLKASPIIGTHSRPPRDLDKKKKRKLLSRRKFTLDGRTILRNE